MSEDIRVRIGLEGAPQVQAGLQGVAKGAESVGQALGRLGPASATLANNMGMVGVSAGQATNAMRQLPAQITDIVTGLASGQAPLTVLIQQGGQLRDSFGSVGNVLRGLASVISPATVALGAVAGTVGAIALAYKQGAEEADAYRRALVLTGNAAGATVGQLQQAAAAVAAVVGTQGKAAEAIAALAATGRVAAADIGRLAEAAIRLEREGGPAVKDTVKAFAELGATDVRGAVEKLNESTNFLTLSLYKQISALQERGKADEAAKLAQTAYASAIGTRAKELEGSLGSLKRAWRSVTEGAKAAWDAMLGVGRKETAVSLYEKVANEIARIRDASGGGSLVPRDPADGTASALRLRQLEQMRDGLARLAYEESKLGIVEAANARQVKDAIAAEAERLAALKKSAAEYQRLVDHGRDLAQGLELEASGFSATFVKDVQAIQAYAKAAGLSAEQTKGLIDQLRAKQPGAIAAAKAEAEAHKDIVAAMGKEMEVRQKHLDALTKDVDAQVKANQKLEDEIVRLRDGEAALEARVELRQREEIALLELEAARALLERSDAAEYERLRQRASALEREVELRRELGGVKSANAARDAAAKEAEAAARAWERTADSIRDGLTDAFRRAFESGEDFGTAMAKVIERELKARIATALAGLLADGVLAVAGMSAGGDGGNGATTSTVLGGANLATNVARIYGAGGSGTGSLLASANYANVYSGTAYGTAYGSQQSAMLASQEAGMVNASTASYASWAGYAALAIMAAIQGSADYSAGFRRQQSRDSGTALGDASARTAQLFDDLGVSDRIADLISGATLTARLFGRAAPRVEAQGVQGTLAAGDFTGQAFADVVEKGGLFRSDKRYQQLADLPQDLGRFLDDAAQAVLDQAQEFGAALGLPAEKLAGVTSDIKVTLTSDADANIKALSEALGGYGEALVAGYADAVKPLATYGETTTQTLQRVGAAIVGVNDVLQALGGTALAASIDGGKAAVALQDLFGGLQGLQQAAGSYLQNFYTDAERADLARRAIGDSLSDLGLQLPATRDAFRALVQAQDLTTDSGRRAVAALMGVQQAFADITPAARSAAEILDERRGLEEELLRLQGNAAELRQRERAALDESNRSLYDQVQALRDQQEAAEQAAQAAQALADNFGALRGQLLQGVRSAYDSVSSTVAAERQRVQSDADAQIAQLEQQAARLKQLYGGVIDAIRSSIDRINGAVAPDGGRGDAMGTLRQALVDLRRGRRVDLDALRNAAGTVAQLDNGSFGTRADFVRALAATGQLLRDVQGAARDRLRAETGAIAARQVQAEAERDRQLALLDQQLAEARSAAETLVSIDDGVRSVADAMDRLASAIGAVGAAGGLPGAPLGEWLRSGDTEVWRSSGGAVAMRAAGAAAGDTFIRGLSGGVFTAADAQGFLRDRIQAGDFAGIVARAVVEGIDSASVDALLGLPRGTALEEARKRGLPAFAAGSAFVPATGLALVHQGERIVPAADNAALTRAMTGGGAMAELLAEVRALREQAMRNDAAIASHTRKSAELLDDVVNGGASVATRAEA